MREAREPSAITIPIIVQDPRKTPNPVNVTVRGPLLAGPIGERLRPHAPSRSIGTSI